VHCFNGYVERETKAGPVGHSAVLRGGVESIFFSGAVQLSNPVDDSQNVAMCLPREICMVWDYTQTERGMRVMCWLGFPCRVYIDLNRCDSQI
jgi:hypothetical protein